MESNGDAQVFDSRRFAQFRNAEDARLAMQGMLETMKKRRIQATSAKSGSDSSLAFPDYFTIAHQDKPFTLQPMCCNLRFTALEAAEQFKAKILKKSGKDAFGYILADPDITNPYEPCYYARFYSLGVWNGPSADEAEAIARAITGDYGLSSGPKNELGENIISSAVLSLSPWTHEMKQALQKLFPNVKKGY